MKPYILSETNYKSAKDQQFDLAVLPWGATEAHNMHLPYGTDNIETEKIASEAGRLAWEAGARVIILPVVPYGVNTGQKDVLLDLNIKPSTQLVVLNDIVEVLNHQKIYKLLILNGHGGNEFRPLIRETGYRYPEMSISLCSWYQVLRTTDYFEVEGEHAGEMETSLILYMAPELVRPLSDAGRGKEKKHRLAAFREGWAWAERKWPLVTEDTGIGDPSGATVAKGRRYFADLTKKISTLMIELARIDINNMYQKE